MTKHKIIIHDLAKRPRKRYGQAASSKSEGLKEDRNYYISLHKQRYIKIIGTDANILAPATDFSEYFEMLKLRSMQFALLPPGELPC